MDIVLKVLTEAFESNLQYTILMDIVIGFLFLFNILLGTIIGTKEQKFDIKKFLFGILKAVCVLFIIVGVCYILNVFTLTLNKIDGINLDTDFIGTMELIAILVTQGVDLSKEVIDKIKAFRELKYVSYDNVKVKNDDIIMPIEERG